MHNSANEPKVASAQKIADAFRVLTIQGLPFVLWVIVVIIACYLWTRGLGNRKGLSLAVESGSLLAIGVGILPYLLAYWVSLLLNRRWDPDNLGSPNIGLNHPPNCKQTCDYPGAKELWDYEVTRFKGALTRASDYAFLFGAIASIIIELCTISYMIAMIAPARNGNEHSIEQIALSVGVGTAALVYFAVSFGGFLQRESSLDANARLFAGACRNLLMIVPSAFFLIGMMCGSTALEELCRNALGAALVGAAIGLLGDRIFGEVTDRAASFLGVKSLTPQHTSDLRQIDGLNDEEVSRLAEEGVDSVHGLAFVPTARLFFNTTYSLPCICDWQDQALLIEYFGAKVQILRERLMIRGILDAREIFQRLDRTLSPTAPLTCFALTVAATEKPNFEELAKLLGFNSNEQRELATCTLRGDAVINRLEAYHHSTVSWREAGTKDDKHNNTDQQEDTQTRAQEAA